MNKNEPFDSKRCVLLARSITYVNWWNFRDTLVDYRITIRSEALFEDLWISSIFHLPSTYIILVIIWLQNGILSGLPFICSYLASVVFCYVADLLVTRQIMSLVNVRKIFTAVGKSSSVRMSFISNKLCTITIMPHSQRKSFREFFSSWSATWAAISFSSWSYGSSPSLSSLRLTLVRWPISSTSRQILPVKTTDILKSYLPLFSYMKIKAGFATFCPQIQYLDW